MKTVLVTGAAGFIGFHAALALKERGDQVIGIDNFNSYYSPLLKRKRASILEEKGVEVVEGDVNQKELLEELFKKHLFTDVLHLAAQAGVRYARKNPEAYISSNIDGFLAILETLKSRPHVKLTYASSSSVYGNNAKTPFSIYDRTDSPANLYAATKKTNELMAYCYHHLYQIPSIGLRYFTVYGPWGRPDMAYFLFTEAMIKKEPIHLFNQGLMSRDFTYIDDIVEGTLAALDYPGKLEIFNLGNNTPVELMTFVSLLEKQLKIEATKIYLPKSLGEVETTFADIEESRSKLGFEPKVSLEQGLERFIAWRRSLDFSF